MAQEFDLFSRQFKRDPFPTFAQMRRHAPIYLHVAPNGVRVWYVTRYEEAVDILKDNDRFCKNFRNALPAAERGKMNAGIQNVLSLINQNMLFSDPPNHTRLRSLVSQAFTPRRMEALAPRIRQIADELLNQAAPHLQMELIAEYAAPLPFVVIADMLGIPPEDRQQVRVWAETIIAPGSRGIKVSQRKSRIRAFAGYVDKLFAQRQAQPRDDLLTALAAAEDAGDKLSDVELSSMVMLLLVTGYETTVNLIGNGALALLEHPDQLGMIRDNPALMAPAVEEILRFDGPVETSTSRWARRDFTYQGYQIKRGDMVRVALSSANRDSSVFDQPDRFDIRRSEEKHVAFGLGIHYCLGAPLARLEGEIALSQLFNRCRHLRLALPASQLEWRSGALFRGLKALPVLWGS